MQIAPELSLLPLFAVWAFMARYVFRQLSLRGGNVRKAVVWSVVNGIVLGGVIVGAHEVLQSRDILQTIVAPYRYVLWSSCVGFGTGSLMTGIVFLDRTFRSHKERDDDVQDEEQ